MRVQHCKETQRPTWSSRCILSSWQNFEAGVVVHQVATIISVRLQGVSLVPKEVPSDVHALEGYKSRKEFVLTDPPRGIQGEDVIVPSMVLILKEENIAVVPEILVGLGS